MTATIAIVAAAVTACATGTFAVDAYTAARAS